jgi:hypothetical protein
MAARRLVGREIFEDEARAVALQNEPLGLNVHASPARPLSVSHGYPPLRRAGVRLYRLV